MKRNLYTLALALGLSITAVSQVELVGETNVATGTIADTEIDVGWDVINTSGMTLNMTCKRVPVYEVPGTQSQYCWGILCSAYGTGLLTLSEVVPLDNGQSTNSFHVRYKPNAQAGQTVLKFCYADDAHLIDEFCYEINFCVDAACVVDVHENGPKGQITQISPNPIEKIGNLTYAFNTVPSSGKIVIHNMMGALVKEIPLTSRNGVVLLNAADFESGIYFCSIQDQGTIFQTQRLVINR